MSGDVIPPFIAKFNNDILELLKLFLESSDADRYQAFFSIDPKDGHNYLVFTSAIVLPPQF